MLSSNQIDGKIIETNQDVDDFEDPKDNDDINSKDGTDHNMASFTSY
jgi:hypothetical protein